MVVGSLQSKFPLADSKEELKKIVMASLPHYAKSYGLNLEEWAESRKNRTVVQND